MKSQARRPKKAVQATAASEDEDVDKDATIRPETAGEGDVDVEEMAETQRSGDEGEEALTSDVRSRSPCDAPASMSLVLIGTSFSGDNQVDEEEYGVQVGQVSVAGFLLRVGKMRCWKIFRGWTQIEVCCLDLMR
jgi:hypothetical protein